jgi:segregation and condensation protein B
VARRKKKNDSDETQTAMESVPLVESVTVAESAAAESSVEPFTETVSADEQVTPPTEHTKVTRRKKKKLSDETQTAMESVTVAASDAKVAVSLDSLDAVPGVESTDAPADVIDAPTVDETELVQKLSAEELERTIEALLFAAEEPLAPREIARASGSDSATVRKVLMTIKAKYETERRPWELLEVASGYRLMTRSEFFSAIQRLKTQTAQRKLTQAGLETLALIAYRQPIGRAEIETVRGVNVGPVLRQLLDKKLIRITGRGAGLGQPLLYGTSDYFLENFGIKSMQELPKPGEFKNI